MIAFLSVPGVILLALLIALIPVLYQGTRAYRKVFVAPAQHDTRPVLPVINAAGTPEISTAVSASTNSHWNGKDRVNILLIGVDRRANEVARSDTMILVSVDPVTKTASMLSIPRDLKVVIPGHGVDKMNAAYAFGDASGQTNGGPSLCIRTIEANFGLHINFFAEVDFKGFIKLVDLVGGITLDVPYPIKDDAYPADGDNYTRVYFHTGWQHMDGTRALEYARTRHDDGDGSRSVRQQQVLLALRQRAIQLNLLPKAADLIQTIGDSVRTDLSPTQAIQLARLGAEIGQGGITQYSLDAALSEDSAPDQPYYLVADWDAVGQIVSKFAGTTIHPPAAALAHPNYAIPIHVENGTLVNGLAHRVATVLMNAGFTNVTVGNRSDAGDYPQTMIQDGSGSVATSAVVAGLVGVSADAISESYGGNQTAAATTLPAVMTGTPTAGVFGAITVILGDNAPDPAHTVPDNDPNSDIGVTGDADLPRSLQFAGLAWAA